MKIYKIANEESKSTEELISYFTDFFGTPYPKDWDWIAISEYKYLTEDFIRRFKNKVSWRIISMSQRLSEEFIAEFSTRVNWFLIATKQRISRALLDQFKIYRKDYMNNILDVYYRYNHCVTPQEKIKYLREIGEIEQYNPNVHELQYLDKQEDPQNANTDLDKFKKLVSFNLNKKITIAQTDKPKTAQELIDLFTRKFGNINKWDWFFISGYQNLSEDFIRLFKDKVGWNEIVRKQKLSEDFLEENADKVHWALVARHQNISKDFLLNIKEEYQKHYLGNFIGLYHLENPYCPLQEKIKWMRENGLIEQYDPRVHELQYLEQDESKETKPNKDLEDFRKLVSSKTNNTKIYRIAQEYAPISEEDDGYHEKIDSAYKLFQDNKIRTNRNKTVSDIALKNGKVIGAVSCEWNINEDKTIFSFDIVVNKGNQGQGVGGNLIREILRKYNNEKNDYIDMGLKPEINVEVVNIKFAEFLIREFGFEISRKLTDRYMLRKE